MILPNWLYFAGSILAGAMAGAGFALAWRLCFPTGVQGRFWAALSALAQETLTVDVLSEFLALYRRLSLTLGGYLIRNLGVLAGGGLALAAGTYLAVQPLQARRDANGGQVRAWPASVERTALRRADGVSFTVAGARITTAADARHVRTAVCASQLSCLGLSILGFRIVQAPAAAIDEPVVVRVDHGDVNPFHPFLSDLEATFLFAAALTMSAGALGRRRQEPASDRLDLRQSDFALIQINEQLKPLIRRLGDMETRLVRRRLDELSLDSPIFITGLARSGSTTLLNALTRSRELGAHQYRDFPFLGAILSWNAVQGTISKPGAAVERPHKDRILITRSSPEAFEEPLWGQFFPHLHAVGASQRLGEGTENPQFEAFFTAHMRKVLLLREAKRYVSKGNYNVARIEYLARMFPDAWFIIPVRAPLDHVSSLVRQHELFCRYARLDPRVPHYLAAAGHFEFGPQRRPICLSPESVESVRAFGQEGDAIGYARQWAEVYGHVARLKAAGDALSGRIILTPYEAFCARPLETLASIVRTCGLSDPEGAIAAFAETVSISQAPLAPSVLAAAGEIEAIVGPVVDALRSYGGAPGARA